MNKSCIILLIFFSAFACGKEKEVPPCVRELAGDYFDFLQGMLEYPEVKDLLKRVSPTLSAFVSETFSTVEETEAYFVKRFKNHEECERLLGMIKEGRDDLEQLPPSLPHALLMDPSVVRILMIFALFDRAGLFDQ